MKFKDMPVIINARGVECVETGIVKGDRECSCVICGLPTEFMEIYIGDYFCSDECVEEYYKNMPGY